MSTVWRYPLKIKNKPDEVHMTGGKCQDFPQAQKLHSNYSLLECDVMYFDIQVPTFRRNLLMLSTVQKEWPQNVLFYETANCNLHKTAVRISNITKTKADLKVDTLFCAVYCRTLSADVLQHWMVWKWFWRSSLDLLYQKDWAEQQTISVGIASELDDIGTRHFLNKSL